MLNFVEHLFKKKKPFQKSNGNTKINEKLEKIFLLGGCNGRIEHIANKEAGEPNYFSEYFMFLIQAESFSLYTIIAFFLKFFLINSQKILLDVTSSA